MRKNIKSQLRSLVATIEDKLINRFDHRKRSSSICMSGETCDLEVSYDALTGKVEAMIYGDDVEKPRDFDPFGHAGLPPLATI